MTLQRDSSHRLESWNTDGGYHDELSKDRQRSVCQLLFVQYHVFWTRQGNHHPGGSLRRLFEGPFSKIWRDGLRQAGTAQAPGACEHDL